MRKINFIDPNNGLVLSSEDLQTSLIEQLPLDAKLYLQDDKHFIRSVYNLGTYNDDEVIEGESMTDNTYYKPLKEQVERIMKFNWPQKGDVTEYDDVGTIDDIELPEDILDAIDTAGDFIASESEKPKQATDPIIDGSMTPDEPKNGSNGDENSLSE